MELGLPKSNREWMYLVCITVLFELIFLHMIYNYGQDIDVKKAWDFAAVLISIILALIAILYSMFQGMTQQSSIGKLHTSAEMLEGQIGSLQGVVTEVKTSKEALNTELGLIGNVTTKLEELAAGIKSQDSKLASLQDTISKFTEEFNKPQKTSAIENVAAALPKVDIPVALFERVLGRASFGSTIPLYAITKIKDKLEDKKIMADAIYPILLPADAGDESKRYLAGLYLGLFTGVRHMLYGLGCIDKSSGKSALNAPYQAAAEKYFEKEITFKNDTDFPKIKKRIDELAASGDG